MSGEEVGPPASLPQRSCGIPTARVEGVRGLPRVTQQGISGMELPRVLPSTLAATVGGGGVVSKPAFDRLPYKDNQEIEQAVNHRQNTNAKITRTRPRRWRFAKTRSRFLSPDPCGSEGRSVASSIPGQSTCLGFGLDPSLVGALGEATGSIDGSFSHQCFSPSVSPCLPLSLKLKKRE